MTHTTHSVHTLVRHLKSSTDPPSSLGPSKIEVASLAWSDSSFGAANKGEVIGEWILTQFGQAKKTGREKAIDSASDPIADPRYWALLCNILTTLPPTAARPTRTWLLPLLNRIQLNTVVVELLALHSSQVLAPARAVLAVLWPLAEKKINIDALGACLGAVFEACAEWNRVHDDLCWICSAVVGAYTSALANAGNKKKLYYSFLDAHLSSWLCATSPSSVSPPSLKRLQDSIYVAGTDTLFSLEALKQPLDTLFSRFSSSESPISSLLPVLPKLFASFLSATHRHRSALSVSASTAVGGEEGVRKRGMEFVERCWILISCPASLQDALEVEKWRSAIGVFGIVERERLFVLRSTCGAHINATNGKQGEEGGFALDGARDKAIEVLETVDVSSKDSRAELVVLTTQLLGVLVQIEYDLVGSELERILSALINLPPSLFSLVMTKASEFLTHVLQYHTKTRTVHTYALTLLGAVTASCASSASSSSLSLATKSTFPLAYHLPALAHALRTSLIPTQIAPLAIAVLQAVENAWSTFKDARQGEEKTTKKRKVTVTEDADNNRRGTRSILVQARVFSYTSQVAGTILSNLPTTAYDKCVEYSLEHSWDDVGELGWAITWDCLKVRIGEEHDIMKDKNGKKRKQTTEKDPPSTPFTHTVASATLRFLYDVRARTSSLLGGCDRLAEVNVRTLLDAAQDQASDPELVLETIRTLLWHTWYKHSHEFQKQTETQSIFTTILDIITARPLCKLKWSGVSAALTRDNLGLAVLYVLTDRWIDVFDMLASTENLGRLTSLFLFVSLEPSDEDTGDCSAVVDMQQGDVTVTLRGILLRLFRNAQFWELHNIRTVFLTSMLTLTTPLSSHCIPSAAIESSLRAAAMAQTELTSACNMYRLLHYVPTEYFTRPVRTELVKRATAGDIQICKVLEGENGQRNEMMGNDVNRSNVRYWERFDAEKTGDGVSAEELKKWSRRLMFVRIFLQRMGLLNTPSHSTSLDFVNHLLSSPSCVAYLSEALTRVTLDLIQLHILNLMRSREAEAMASISSVISTLTVARPFSRPVSQETWTHMIVQSSVLNFIERLTGDFDPASLPDSVKRALKTLFEALETTLFPHARRLVGRDTDLDQSFSSERIKAWSRTLSLARWLGMPSQVASVSLGLKLATSIIHTGHIAIPNSKIYSDVLGLLFEELWCVPEESHCVHLDVLVGFYVVNGNKQGIQSESPLLLLFRASNSSRKVDIMDLCVAQASKKLSVEDFSYILNIVAEGIGGSRLQVGQRERLIRLGKVVLHDAPQGTLKVIQNFVTRCFNLFAHREEIYGGSSPLKMQCLEFIAKYCSDRPAAVRSVDLGSIWSLLNKILSGSPEHEATTTFSIFHHIVTTIGALIRLRRDIVVHTLPHLSLVLRQLIMLNRKIRPQLGARQSKIVTDTFPSWLSASQPLSTGEARALARLLTSLTTKTVPRTHTYVHPSASLESQKAESLAKPFSKHASYVLVAYVDAFNDPLCIINAEMRKELEPGLFALCEMVGEHSRDALMMSALDSGGKTIFKSLWKEYERQRYVGKG